MFLFYLVMLYNVAVYSYHDELLKEIRVEFLMPFINRSAEVTTVLHSLS